MIKLLALSLAVFNIVACAASIAGLYLALVTVAGHTVPAFGEYDQRVLVILFVVTLVFSVYVLFVPANPIERNVRAKLKHYKYPLSGTVVSLQGDEFTHKPEAMLPIPFPHPFAAPPKVELIQIGGDPKYKVDVGNITTFQFEVVCMQQIMSLLGPGRYRWIATGTLLDEIRK
jgi:hypothetical protein